MACCSRLLNIAASYFKGDRQWYLTKSTTPGFLAGARLTSRLQPARKSQASSILCMKAEDDANRRYTFRSRAQPIHHLTRLAAVSHSSRNRRAYSEVMSRRCGPCKQHSKYACHVTLLSRYQVTTKSNILYGTQGLAFVRLSVNRVARNIIQRSLSHQSHRSWSHEILSTDRAIRSLTPRRAIHTYTE